MRFSLQSLRSELEVFRVAYEARHGETDLTKRYTSTWATVEQEWLMTHEPKRYFDGLPPFVQAFIREKMKLATRNGKLDDMPTEYLKLFMAGKMGPGGHGRGR